MVGCCCGWWSSVAATTAAFLTRNLVEAGKRDDSTLISWCYRQFPLLTFSDNSPSPWTFYILPSWFHDLISISCIAMSSQHDLRIPDAFTRSSTASPDSGIHLSDGVEGAICSRKRKRADDAAAQDLLKDTFVVKVRSLCLWNTSNLLIITSHILQNLLYAHIPSNLWHSFRVYNFPCRPWIFTHHSTLCHLQDCLKRMLKFWSWKNVWEISLWYW